MFKKQCAKSSWTRFWRHCNHHVGDERCFFDDYKEITIHHRWIYKCCQCMKETKELWF